VGSIEGICRLKILSGLYLKIHMTSRDDFPKPIIETLAKRAGYICSNPSCRKHTSGPNTTDHKSTLIGEAAHITAASPKGPRYDSTLSSDERRNINNAIWLCSNCASLIDKDEKAYTVALLNYWKEQAEEYMRNALNGGHSIQQTKQGSPLLEAELIFHSNQQKSQYCSNDWELEWHYELFIHNTSSFPAFNVKIIPDNTEQIELGYYQGINNIPALGKAQIKFQTKTVATVEYYDIDILLSHPVPRHLIGSTISIIYRDESRDEHETIVTFKDNGITNLQIR
jgi:hypothetical protein